MEMKPYYFVFSAPYDQEENDYKSCYILVNIPYPDITAFADYLETNTVLSVDAFVKHDYFYTNFGDYLLCTVFEVHVKEETGHHELSCEEIAERETLRYLKEHGYRYEVAR